MVRRANAHRLNDTEPIVFVGDAMVVGDGFINGEDFARLWPYRPSSGPARE